MMVSDCDFNNSVSKMWRPSLTDGFSFQPNGIVLKLQFCKVFSKKREEGIQSLFIVFWGSNLIQMYLICQFSETPN